MTKWLHAPHDCSATTLHRKRKNTDQMVACLVQVCSSSTPGQSVGPCMLDCQYFPCTAPLPVATCNLYRLNHAANPPPPPALRAFNSPCPHAWTLHGKGEWRSFHARFPCAANVMPLEEPWHAAPSSGQPGFRLWQPVLAGPPLPEQRPRRPLLSSSSALPPDALSSLPRGAHRVGPQQLRVPSVRRCVLDRAVVQQQIKVLLPPPACRHWAVDGGGVGAHAAGVAGSQAERHAAFGVAPAGKGRSSESREGGREARERAGTC
eukprot:350415-Chlamydomonas_euryale.AAC.8